MVEPAETQGIVELYHNIAGSVTVTVNGSQTQAHTQREPDWAHSKKQQIIRVAK